MAVLILVVLGMELQGPMVVAMVVPLLQQAMLLLEAMGLLLHQEVMGRLLQVQEAPGVELVGDTPVGEAQLDLEQMVEA